MKFTKETCQDFRVQFDRAVKELEDKLGVKIDLGNIRFSEGGLQTTLTVSNATTAPGNAKWHLEFTRGCEAYGFKPEVLGREITYGGQAYVLAGARWGARLPIILQNKATKKFITTTLDALYDGLGVPNKFKNLETKQFEARA